MWKLALLTMAAIAPVSGAWAEALKAGTNQVTLKYDGHEREMLIRLPENYTPEKKYPVIFGFHGANGPMEGYHRQLERLVDKEGIISVSPQGVSNARGVTGWNGFEGHRISNTDDVGLVEKIVAHLDEHASIDRGRLYATGGSSGAIFCFRLALETDLFAAIAPMRGAMSKRNPTPKGRPKVSILLVCGTEAPLYQGGTGAPGEEFYSAHEAMALWATNHGGASKPEVISQEAHRTLTRFSPPDAPYELLLYAVEGKGHQLGRDQMTKALASMWDFFKRHPKHRPAAAGR